MDKASLPAASHGFILHQILNTSMLAAWALLAAPAGWPNSIPQWTQTPQLLERRSPLTRCPTRTTEQQTPRPFKRFTHLVVYLRLGTQGLYVNFSFLFKGNVFYLQIGKRSLPPEGRAAWTDPNIQRAFGRARTTPQTHTLLTPADTSPPRHHPHLAHAEQSCVLDTTHSSTHTRWARRNPGARPKPTATVPRVAPSGAQSQGWRQTVRPVVVPRQVRR